MTRPKLYPGHQHQWADHEPGCSYLDYGMAAPGSCDCTPMAPEVRCTVCGFTAPRNLANLDGKPADAPVTDKGGAT